MNDDWVSASEISEWVYCRRAWWYARQRLPTLAAPALARGAARHDALAHAARRIERQQRLAARLLIAGLAFALLLGALVAIGGWR